MNEQKSEFAQAFLDECRKLKNKEINAEIIRLKLREQNCLENNDAINALFYRTQIWKLQQEKKWVKEVCCPPDDNRFQEKTICTKET